MALSGKVGWAPRMIQATRPDLFPCGQHEQNHGPRWAATPPRTLSWLCASAALGGHWLSPVWPRKHSAQSPRPIRLGGGGGETMQQTLACSVLCRGVKGERKGMTARMRICAHVVMLCWHKVG